MKRIMLALFLIGLLALVGCSKQVDQQPKTIADAAKDVGGYAPPGTTTKACSVTADKYILPVGAQNRYYLSADPMINCEVITQRQGQEPVLDRIVRTDTKGLKTEIITHQQTGIYNIWVSCGTCTSDVLTVTVTSQGTQPQPLTCQDYANQAGPNANMQPNVADNARCSAIAANHCGANGVASGQFYPTLSCCIWTCNQAQATPYICCLVGRQRQCIQGTRCANGITPVTRYGSLAECQNHCAAIPATDTDGDGIPDSTDTDDDNDGVSDIDEIAAGTDPKDATDKPTLCSDSDGGNMPLVFGGATAGLATQYDYCDQNDNHFIYEAYCTGYTYTNVRLDCRNYIANGVCKDGKCITPVNSPPVFRGKNTGTCPASCTVGQWCSGFNAASAFTDSDGTIVQYEWVCTADNCEFNPTNTATPQVKVNYCGGNTRSLDIYVTARDNSGAWDTNNGRWDWNPTEGNVLCTISC